MTAWGSAAEVKITHKGGIESAKLPYIERRTKPDGDNTNGDDKKPDGDNSSGDDKKPDSDNTNGDD